MLTLTWTTNGDCRLSRWLRVRVREFAVAPTVIETVTARRHAGDWAGAATGVPASGAGRPGGVAAAGTASVHRNATPSASGRRGASRWSAVVVPTCGPASSERSVRDSDLT
ncbi:hypothetical protein KCMC57_up05740 [Kitasatospora sp. CMC57]|uniref:Uncharacterized protein n=1 Tax=Kitasatospora sp. CMC57 TaxID=3231513 RepID=A0AB33JUZ6_9ACTN